MFISPYATVSDPARKLPRKNVGVTIVVWRQPLHVHRSVRCSRITLQLCALCDCSQHSHMAARATLTSIQLSFVAASISKHLEKKQALFLTDFFPYRFSPANRRRAPGFRCGDARTSKLEATPVRERRLHFEAHFYWSILSSRKCGATPAHKSAVICCRVFLVADEGRTRLLSGQGGGENQAFWFFCASQS